MQLIVTGRHVNVTAPMKRYAREKLERIMTERPHINEAHVIMDVQKYRHRVEITVRGKDLELFCHEETPDMYASIDSAVAKLERQLRRFKELHTRKSRGLRASHRMPPLRRSGETGEITLRFAMRPMFPAEALLQMKTQGHLFFAFLNAETDRVNLLVRPGEGEIGLLAPKALRGPGRPASFQMRVYREPSIAAEGRPRTERREVHSIGWETPEEAVEAMEAAGDKYRFFMNAESKLPCVVYEQSNGDFGLIEPGQ